MLQLHTELLAGAAPRLGHERERVRRRGAVRVLDEIRVLRRDLGAAAVMPLEAAGLEHPTRAQLVLGILEDAAEGPPVRRLRLLAASVQVTYLSLDLVRRPRQQPQLRAQDDLSVPELGVPVAQPELGRCQPAAAVGRRDECPLEHAGEVPAVGSAVHPYAPADRARDRTRELEAAEPGGACTVQYRRRSPPRRPHAACPGRPPRRSRARRQA